MKRPEGFSLLEVLIASIVMSVAMVALLQGLLLAVKVHSSSRQDWEKTVERYSRAQFIRSAAASETAKYELKPVPEIPGLLKIELEGNEVPAWEVLRVE